MKVRDLKKILEDELINDDMDLKIVYLVNNSEENKDITYFDEGNREETMNVFRIEINKYKNVFRILN